METLFLASASPRRAQLLREAGVRFEARPVDVAENGDARTSPETLVLQNAAAKARALAAELPRALVLGCDTTVSLDGENLNKPADIARAREMLRRLSGRVHTVYTGLCLLDGERGRECAWAETSRVRFKTLDDAVIGRYFNIVNPLDKAGAYGIQEGRELIIEGWEGSLANIMGLPIEALEARLRAWGLWEALRAR